MITNKAAKKRRGKRALPVFPSLEEESSFWDTHSFLDYGQWQVIPYEELCRELGSRNEPKTPVTIRLEKGLVRRLRDAARRHGIKYQVLIREILWRSISRSRK